MSPPAADFDRIAEIDLVRRLPPSPARDDVERLLWSAPDPFDRSAPEHITASALVVDQANERVLLVQHRKLGRWLQPGGHVERVDERIFLAALREAREETGIPDLGLAGGVPLHVDRHAAPCLPPGGGVHLDLLYLCSAPPGPRPAVSPESADVRWFDVGQLPDDALPGLADRVRERPAGTSRERNDADFRRLVGLRSDLPWVREVLARHDAGDGTTVVRGGMRKVVLTRDEATLDLDLP